MLLECASLLCIPHILVLQSASSESRLEAVLKEPDNPRQALHGVRRSKYLAPPTFEFSCQEVLEEVNENLRLAQRAVSFCSILLVDFI